MDSAAPNFRTLRPGAKAERMLRFERAAIDVEQRTVDLAFSSETPYERTWGVEILDHSKKSIRLDRLKKTGPAVIDHSSSVRDLVGKIESIVIGDDRVGRCRIRLGTDETSDMVFKKIQDGLLTEVSVAYLIHDAKVEKTADRGPDTYRVTDWEPYHVSFVAEPADCSVGIGRSMDESPFSASPLKETHMEQTSPVADTAAIETRAADGARQAEMRRVNEILDIGTDHADVGGIELAREAVKSGLSVGDFNAKLLAAKVSGRSAAEITFGKAARAKDNLADDPKAGYRSYGDFCSDVIRAASGKGESERLVRAATVFGNEAVGPDGGYAVPPQFATDIASIAYAEESLLSRCDVMPIAGNTMTFPKDETTPWGSTGVTAGWEGEGAQTTPKKPALGESTLKLRKLKVLVAASEELLADAAGMTSYITRKTGEAVDWKVNDAIVNGTGAGMPLGILNAASLVAQAKEGSQAADTVVAGNIAKMYGRCIMGAGANVVWLMNPDVFQQVMQLSLNSNPIWVPANQGFAGAPNGLLMGRPIVLSDACDTVGDQGDIILANLSGYRAITKAGGAEFATSMHLWFDQDLMAFRLTFRMDGQPALAAAVTPPNSSITRSHFVALAART